eukprot:gnl/Trimastix_PCT/187.p1 GENE.gnl/Trimastix_PCT/187~~gnl/Trimastix_PCT/187.p1  ORF type:complete len:481 (+),score=184.99 gnl/Trimastix_PCT/187:831-2273(+)
MGGRHEMLIRYKMAARPDGKLVAMEAEVICDGGFCHDVTGPVLDKCIFQLQNVYTIPHIRYVGRAARTNRPTQTAFRGFGAPQHCAMMEQIMDQMGCALRIPQHTLREMNLNRAGDDLVMGAYVSRGKGEPNIRIIWDQIMELSDFKARHLEVERFNTANRYVKRGLSIVPMKNGVCFEEDFMNQAHALVHVLADGSVQLSHGGIEMGQGLNTKMAMICAQELGIPFEKVNVVPASTLTCANTQPTAASSGSDSNGPAVLAASREVRQRLDELRKSQPADVTWESLINTAYFSRVNLTGTSHFFLPKLGWHWDTREGYTAFYYDFGASVSEVEVDLLTGEFKVLRVDILEDTGRSLNPTLDLGQVEGGFTQGYGWLTMEEIEWAPSGQMKSHPFTYPVPLMTDMPLDFRTHLCQNFRQPENIHSSKSAGEAPVLLGTSVVAALKMAIMSARQDRGLTPWILVDYPLTVDKIKRCIEHEVL